MSALVSKWRGTISTLSSGFVSVLRVTALQTISRYFVWGGIFVASSLILIRIYKKIKCDYFFKKKYFSFYLIYTFMHRTVINFNSKNHIQKEYLYIFNCLFLGFYNLNYFFFRYHWITFRFFERRLVLWLISFSFLFFFFLSFSF